MGERSHRQRLSLAAPHPPRHDSTRGEIQHHRQIEPALGGPDVRDGAGPHSVGCSHGKLPVERIRHDRIRLRQATGVLRSAGLGLKGWVTPRTARGPSRRCVDNPDLGDQPSILSRAETLRPSHPGRVARGDTASSRHGTRPTCARMARHLMPTAWRSTPPHFFKNPARASPLPTPA